MTTDDRAVTDHLREIIEAEFFIEREGWAAERVNRVTARFDPSFQTLVLWGENSAFSHGAFTGPGKTVYIDRRLLERLPDDDAVAFVIAHELAHHRLGHVMRSLWHLPLRLMHSWITTTSHERDADRLAIEMCIEAGYDVERCVHALQQLLLVSLDYRDLDGVFGGDERPHPPLLTRIEAVRIHAARFARGHRLAVELDERAKTRRRR